jgi:DNA adenine methylase
LLSQPEAEPVADERHVTSSDIAALVPFLKWPGGKRWLVSAYPQLVPTTFNRYIEPFLGGGSVYFHLQPRSALLGDINGDVVVAYEGLQKQPEKVLHELTRHHKNHDNDYYYNVRDVVPKTLAARAARVIYLNRTCFNGIYRVNRLGKFNVPVGNRTGVLYNTDNFPAITALLQSAEIRKTDFEELVDCASAGDLVFADPPYTVTHNNNGFIKYNEKLFSWADQVRLADSLHRAKMRGARVLATNAAHESVRHLYEDRGFALMTVSRFSSIAASSKSRKLFDELLITA